VGGPGQADHGRQRHGGGGEAGLLPGALDILGAVVRHEGEDLIGRRSRSK